MLELLENRNRRDRAHRAQWAAWPLSRGARRRRRLRRDERRDVRRRGPGADRGSPGRAGGRRTGARAGHRHRAGRSGPGGTGRRGGRHRAVSRHGRELLAKPDAEGIEVIVGDMASTRVAGEFDLVFLVFNTIMNLTTQDQQVAVFENAAAHLGPGGCFVLEVVVPDPGVSAGAPGPGLRPRGRPCRHRDLRRPDRPGLVVPPLDGRRRPPPRAPAPYRYVWPSELDLMARVAGLRLRDRWADWTRAVFTADSPSQVVTYEK